MSLSVLIINTGGTIGMVGKPLRAVRSAEDIIANVPLVEGLSLTLRNEHLIDSTDMTHAYRLELFQLIRKHYYDQFEAFVIMQGTDTLEDTCAFMSLAWAGLHKYLFIVGAQRSLDEPGSDAPLQIANTLRAVKEFYDSGYDGGVYTVSASHVYHGARVRKRHDTDYHAFHTPGHLPAAYIGPRFRRGSSLSFQRVGLPPPLTPEMLQLSILTMKVSADSPPQALIALTDTGLYDGIILEGKGAGNVPRVSWKSQRGGPTASWIEAINYASANGVHVAILSPFEEGDVDLQRYAGGHAAWVAGAMSLHSHTPAMAELKFRMAIGLYPKNPDAIKAHLAANWAGELL